MSKTHSQAEWTSGTCSPCLLSLGRRKDDIFMNAFRRSRRYGREELDGYLMDNFKFNAITTHISTFVHPFILPIV